MIIKMQEDINITPEKVLISVEVVGGKPALKNERGEVLVCSGF